MASWQLARTVKFNSSANAKRGHVLISNRLQSVSSRSLNPAEFHERTLRRLLEVAQAEQPWDSAMIHQAKQTIQWRTTSQVPQAITPGAFQDTWRLWEALASQESTTNLGLELFHFLLHQWRSQLELEKSVSNASKSISAIEMMERLDGYSSRGILKPVAMTYDLIIHALTLEAENVPLNSINWAETLLMEMIDRKSNRPIPSIVTFATILQLWLSQYPQSWAGRDQIFIKKVQLLERQRRQLEDAGHSELRPNLKYSTSLMNAYALAGKSHDCQSLWDEWWRESLESKREPPNIQTGTVLLMAWKSQPEQAESILAHLKSLHAKGLMKEPPNVVSYTTVLDAWAKSKNPFNAQKAESILRELCHLDTDGPNVFSYTTVIDAYAKHGNSNKAHSLMREMIQLGIAPNTSTFNALLYSMSDDDPSSALNVLQSMSKLAVAQGWDCHPDAASYTTVIQHFAKAGDWRGAKDVWKEMTKEHVRADVLTLNTLLSALAKAGDVHGAEQAVEQARELWSIQPTVITYTNLLNTWHNYRDGSEATVLTRVEDIVREMKQHSIKPNNITYTVMCKCYARFGRGESAIEVLQKARSQDSEFEPNVMLYTQVLQAIANSARNENHKGNRAVDNAKKIIDEMLDIGVTPNKFAWSSYLKVISNSNHLKKKDLALEAVQLMKQTGTEPNSSLRRQVAKLVGE